MATLSLFEAMKMYLIQRDDGKFVTEPGSQHSYTRNLQWARVYPSREAAEADRCPENERVVELPNIMGES